MVSATMPGLAALQDHVRERQRAVETGPKRAAEVRGARDHAQQVANMPRMSPPNDADTVRIKGSATVLRDGSWSGPALSQSGKVLVRQIDRGAWSYRISWEGVRSHAAKSARTNVGRTLVGPLAADREYAGVKRQSSRSGKRRSARRNTVKDSAVTYRLDRGGGVTRSIQNNKLAAVLKHGDGRTPSRPFDYHPTSWHQAESRAVIDEYIRKPQAQLSTAQVARFALRIAADVIEVVGAAGGV